MLIYRKLYVAVGMAFVVVVTTVAFAWDYLLQDRSVIFIMREYIEFLIINIFCATIYLCLIIMLTLYPYLLTNVHIYIILEVILFFMFFGPQHHYQKAVKRHQIEVRDPLNALGTRTGMPTLEGSGG